MAYSFEPSELLRGFGTKIGSIGLSEDDQRTYIDALLAMQEIPRPPLPNGITDRHYGAFLGYLVQRYNKGQIQREQHISDLLRNSAFVDYINNNQPFWSTLILAVQSKAAISKKGKVSTIKPSYNLGYREAERARADIATILQELQPNTAAAAQSLHALHTQSPQVQSPYAPHAQLPHSPHALPAQSPSSAASPTLSDYAAGLGSPSNSLLGSFGNHSPFSATSFPTPQNASESASEYSPFSGLGSVGSERGSYGSLSGFYGSPKSPEGGRRRSKRQSRVRSRRRSRRR
jgi:hypothetical protein